MYALVLWIRHSEDNNSLKIHIKNKNSFTHGVHLLYPGKVQELGAP